MLHAVGFDSEASTGYIGPMLRARPSGIGPYLPSRADCPPSGANWIHEIKLDGFRLIARPDPDGRVRPPTRNSHDWARARYPLIVDAVRALPVHLACSTARRWPSMTTVSRSFDRLRFRRDDGRVVMFAFDLDGFRLIARRDPAGRERLLTRNGHDWACAIR